MHANPRGLRSGLTGFVAAHWRKTVATVAIVVALVLGYSYLYAPRGNIVIETIGSIARMSGLTDRRFSDAPPDTAQIRRP